MKTMRTTVVMALLLAAALVLLDACPASAWYPPAWGGTSSPWWYPGWNGGSSYTFYAPMGDPWYSAGYYGVPNWNAYGGWSVYGQGTDQGRRLGFYWHGY